MTGFDKYSEIFTNRAKELLEEEDLQKNPEYYGVFKNRLLGLKGPKQLGRKLTPAEVFFLKLNTGFNEIHNSYYSLLDIEVYMGRFPYSNTRVSKTRYLAYHMENYLNEVYILEQRLESYFTIVGRLYRNDRRHQGIRKSIETLISLVQEILKGVIDTRGAHVHRMRFTDEDLDRLDLQEFLSKHGGDELKVLKNFFKFDYGRIRKRYKQMINKNNEQIKIMLDACFDILYEIVADEKRQIKYPKA